MYINNMITETSLYGYLKRNIDAQPEKPKIIYYNREISGREFINSIQSTASFLRRQGLKDGDSVGIALPNIPEALIAFYGANAAGFTANLLNPLLGVPSMAKILSQTSAKIIYILDRIYEKHKDSLKNLGITPIICRVSGFMSGYKKLLLSLTEKKYSEVMVFSEAQIYTENFVESHPNADDAAVYIHSGGTTGEPKTVVHTNYSLNRFSKAVVDTVYEDRGTYGENDSMLMMLPIFHSFGLGIPVHTALCNIKSVLMPRFNEKQAVKLIKKYGITHIAGVPSMYRRILAKKEFRGRKIASLTHLFCGGDRLPVSLKRDFDERIALYGSKGELSEGYGLTETMSVFSLSRNGETKENSQGKPLVGNKIKIIGKDGKPCPTGVPGEIRVMSLSVMKGYLNDEDATNEVLYIDNGEVWLKTGDYGYVDEDGYVYFKEREKRSLKISGVNVFPSETESIIRNIDGIADCCVARAYKNGKPCAVCYAVLEKGTKPGFLIENKIKKTVLKSISKYAVPKDVIFTKELPRTHLGKPDYKKLEEELNEI